MFALEDFKQLTEEQKYENMLLFLKGQLLDEKDIISNLSNASSIIMALTDNLSWAGFYLMKDGELVLGPFQGMPACNRININKGVCGAAVSSREIQRVDDVHKFQDHIACDGSTNSELVVPIIKENKVLGVLDLDSIEFGRFTELEEKYFKKFVQILVDNMDWSIN
ncbi:GAF domain-containing protein [Clostridium sporogenes]|uniref:GAF domain-containing protein n=1 Tax=Clostridium botulinum TaxID=1491 RepID=A0A6M0T4Z4_CLOBO|nr:GAF domain-containing protein [Clostridium sporogenes]NFA61862.1 GAF domain-containing protein [Clostridium botulinum]NFI73879.1 GAF domain-containing protein [Clostridium sporogenes]NFL71691.1 GAF domain-containing protein [Clostridium sporogenes]NFM24319.1 GAF domain-containing protein [Clostridium sporogenes]NFP61753.1 GAF domain-containing protein [Clostridium sporogenes]